MKLCELLDKLAGWWIDWRTERAVRQRPELHQMGIKKVEIGDTSWEVLMTGPGVVYLADEAATMLRENDARNYVTFDMLPRLDKGLPPIRVTVQWARGMSPAEKAAMFEAALVGMVQQHCVGDDGLLRDFAISVNAEALSCLEREGLIELVDERGQIYRWV
jgi:hypothetical protein